MPVSNFLSSRVAENSSLRLRRRTTTVVYDKQSVVGVPSEFKLGLRTLCEIYFSTLNRYRYANNDYFQRKVDGVWSKRRENVARRNSSQPSVEIFHNNFAAYLKERSTLSLDAKPLIMYSNRRVDIIALTELFEMCEFHLEEYRRSYHSRVSVSDQEKNDFDAQWGIGTSRFTIGGAANGLVSTGIIIRDEGFLAHKIGRAYQLYYNNVELMMLEPEHFAGAGALHYVPFATNLFSSNRANFLTVLCRHQVAVYFRE